MARKKGAGFHHLLFTCLSTVEFKNDCVFRLHYLRDIYCNYFTGLGQLGNIAVIPGYPRRANGDIQHLESRPELQDWLRSELFTVNNYRRGHLSK